MYDLEGEIDLNELFLGLIPHSLTPEEVLELLSFHECPPLPTKTFLTFCAAVKYMMAKLSDGFIDGIFEDILKRIVMYTQNFSFLMRTEMYKVITVFSTRMSPYNHTAFVIKLRSWVGEILSCYSNCPDPLLRIELFRLMRLLAFRNERYVSLESVCETFIHTICEIYPAQFYPSGNEDWMLFGVHDFYYFIKQLRRFNLLEHISESEVFINSRAATFISNFIQLIGIYAHMAPSNAELHPDVIYHGLIPSNAELERCCKMLKTFWTQYSYVVSRPQFHHYAVKSFQEVTNAINNSRGLVMENVIMLKQIREFPSQEFGDTVCSKPCDLPRLFMSSQVHGPRALRQHALISKDLPLLYKSTYPKRFFRGMREDEDSSESDNNSDDSNERLRPNDSNYISSSNYSDDASSDYSE